MLSFVVPVKDPRLRCEACQVLMLFGLDVDEDAQTVDKAGRETHSERNIAVVHQHGRFFRVFGGPTVRIKVPRDAEWRSVSNILNRWAAVPGSCRAPDIFPRSHGRLRDAWLAT